MYIIEKQMLTKEISTLAAKSFYYMYLNKHSIKQMNKANGYVRKQNKRTPATPFYVKADPWYTEGEESKHHTAELLKRITK